MASFASDDDAMGDGTGAHHDQLLFGMFDKARSHSQFHMHIEHDTYVGSCVTPVGNANATHLVQSNKYSN